MDSREISDSMAEDYQHERAERGSRACYDAALALVPDVEPEERDKASSGAIKPPSIAEN